MNLLKIALCVWSITVVGSTKVIYRNDPYIGHGPTMPPGPDEPFRLKDGGPLPDCNPCPWVRAKVPHGPTMPPGPDEP